MYTQPIPPLMHSLLASSVKMKIERDAERREAVLAVRHDRHEREFEEAQRLARLRIQADERQRRRGGKLISQQEKDEHAADLMAIKTAEATIARLREYQAEDEKRLSEFCVIEEASRLAREIWRQHSGRPFNLAHTPHRDPTIDPERTVFEKCRPRLMALNQQFEAAERAPRTVTEMKAALAKTLDAATARWSPTLNPRIRTGDPFGLHRAFGLPLADGERGSGDSGLSVLAWYLREGLFERLSMEIGDHDDEGALTDDARDVAFARIAAERLAVEREEEAAVVQAAQYGIIIPRRPDLDPAAYLEIEVR